MLLRISLERTFYSVWYTHIFILIEIGMFFLTIPLLQWLCYLVKIRVVDKAILWLFNQILLSVLKTSQRVLIYYFGKFLILWNIHSLFFWYRLIKLVLNKIYLLANSILVQFDEVFNCSIVTGHAIHLIVCWCGIWENCQSVLFLFDIIYLHFERILLLFELIDEIYILWHIWKFFWNVNNIFASLLTQFIWIWIYLT